MSYYQEDSKGMRMGQYFMNELSKYDLDLYRQIPEEVDCFYQDKLFKDFIGWLSMNWKDTI
jgi:hypothetical protein